MIKVEGYKAFHGKMKISPVSGIEPFVLECDWLYKPDTGCWYGNGSSFGVGICEVVEETNAGVKTTHKVKSSEIITLALNYYCESCHCVVNFNDEYCASCGAKLHFKGENENNV